MFLLKSYYFLLIKFYIISVLFTLLLFILCYFLAPFIILQNKFYLKKDSKILKNKKSAYECGFEPFNDSRGFFEIHFYITGIIFLLFDVEIAFLLPWIVNVKSLFGFSIFSGFFFFFALLLGFVYELNRGALNWPLDYN